MAAKGDPARSTWLLFNVSQHSDRDLMKRLENGVYGLKISSYSRDGEGLEVRFDTAVTREELQSELQRIRRTSCSFQDIVVMPPAFTEVKADLDNEWWDLLKKANVDIDRIAQESDVLLFKSNKQVKVHAESMACLNTFKNKLQEEFLTKEGLQLSDQNQLLDEKKATSNGGTNQNNHTNHSSQYASSGGAYSKDTDPRCSSLPVNINGGANANGSGSERGRDVRAGGTGGKNVTTNSYQRPASPSSSGNLHQTSSTTGNRHSTHSATGNWHSSSSTSGSKRPASPSTSGYQPSSVSSTSSRSGATVSHPVTRITRSISMSSAYSAPGEASFVTPRSRINVIICQGDLTKEKTDVIVSSANEMLDNHLGGVAQAIRNAAGYDLDKECRDYIYKHFKLRPTEVMWTTAGRLKPDVSFVLHAVGPSFADCYYDKEKCERLLQRTFENCLTHANDKQSVRSIAIPAIGSGSFRVPLDVVARAAYNAVMDFDAKMKHGPDNINVIKFVNIDPNITQWFQSVFSKLDDFKPTIKQSQTAGRSTHSEKNSANASVDDPESVSEVSSHVAPQIRGSHGSSSTTPRKAANPLGVNSAIAPQRCHNCDSSNTMLKSRHSCGHKCCLICEYKPCRKCVNDTVQSGSTPRQRDQASSDDDSESRAGAAGYSTGAAGSARGAAGYSSGAAGRSSRSPDNSTSKSRSELRRSGSLPSRTRRLVSPGSDPTDDICVICLSSFTEPRSLECGHTFCRACIEQSFAHQKKCPSCGRLYGVTEGNQPDGAMTISKIPMSLEGYRGCGSIRIYYTIHSGIQTSKHPNPGKYFRGATRTAYLPDNAEGRAVCELLKKAFDKKLVFTVGKSATTGEDNVVVWNDIHHKTSPNGSHGYPDATYLTRVRQELAAKGIVDKQS